MTQKSKTLKPFNGFSTLINVLMGTGPILLPPVVASAGFGLSTIVLLVIMLFSIIGAEYLIEILSITNQIKNILNPNDQFDSINHRLVDDESRSSNNQISDSSDIPSQNQNQTSPQPFEMTETIEYGMMGKILWGRQGQILSTLVVCTYLIGVLISKGIIVGNTMSDVFSHLTVLNSYTFWVILFFIISGAFSFQDVASIAIIQTLVAIFRYLTIFMMFLGAFIQIGKQKQTQKLIWFNFTEFPDLFGTAVFAFLMHHSAPQMMRPIDPQSAIRKVLIIAFLFGMVMFILISLTGALAFEDLQEAKYYNTLFKRDSLYFAYYIISFYMFLNISSLPVLTITLRTNLMKMIAPQYLPKSSLKITRSTAIATFLIIVPSGFLALVVDFTGGICGTIIIFIFPSLMVLNARKRCTNYLENPFKSSFQNPIWAWASIGLGTLIIPYNLYLEIDKLVNN